MSKRRFGVHYESLKVISDNGCIAGVPVVVICCV